MANTDNTVSTASAVSGRVGGDTKNTKNYIDGYNAGFQAAQDAIMEKLTTLTQAVEDRDAEIRTVAEYMQGLELVRDMFRSSSDHYHKLYVYERRAKENAVNQARRWKEEHRTEEFWRKTAEKYNHDILNDPKYGYDTWRDRCYEMQERNTKHMKSVVEWIATVTKAKENAVNQARRWKSKYEESQRRRRETAVIYRRHYDRVWSLYHYEHRAKENAVNQARWWKFKYIVATTKLEENP